jgi:hypothetical protein
MGLHSTATWRPLASGLGTVDRGSGVPQIQVRSALSLTVAPLICSLDLTV